jgi:dTDP-4-amino-4,6-dideoxygalactose transaminase
MSSVLAAVGLAQIATLPQRVAARRGLFARYHAALGDLPGLDLMPEPAWGRSNRWLSVLLLDPGRGAPDREAARLALHGAGIESRPVWKPLHLQPAFRGAPQVGGAIAARLFETGLCLPSGSGLGADDQDRVIETLRALWQG